MALTLLNLILAQMAQGIPWYVWTGAALGFVLGISLVVYFFLRLKKSDKEPEEDWTLSSRSLFANAERRADEVQQDEVQQDEVWEQPAAEIQADETQEIEALPSRARPVQEAIARETEELSASFPEETAALSNDAGELEPRMTERLESAYPIETEQAPRVAEPEPERFIEEPPRETPATQLLGSSPPPASTPAVETPEEDTPFDDIWNELVREGYSKVQTEEVEAGPRAESSQPPQAEPPPVEPPLVAPPLVEPPLVARVEQRPPREPFEPPRMERVRHREPFEPPVILPIEPGEHPLSEPPPARPARPTQMAFDSRETSERKAPPEPSGIEPVIVEPAIERETEPVRVSAVPAQLPRGRKVSGSVLGLPSESTGGPLVFGEPAAETGTVGSLTNYGKDLDKGGGHGGTIALLIAIILVGGGLLAYFYVPVVHARVNAFVGRMRGDDVAAREAAARVIRAQIYPVRRPEVDKNIVKAKGAVYNITDEPLQGLTVEVTLERYDGGPADVRTVGVTPDSLVKDQQGVYEFDYDGKEFRGYRVTKLNTSNGEVRYSTPTQPRS